MKRPAAMLLAGLAVLLATEETSALGSKYESPGEASAIDDFMAELDKFTPAGTQPAASQDSDPFAAVDKEAFFPSKKQDVNDAVADFTKLADSFNSDKKGSDDWPKPALKSQDLLSFDDKAPASPPTASKKDDPFAGLETKESSKAAKVDLGDATDPFAELEKESPSISANSAKTGSSAAFLASSKPKQDDPFQALMAKGAGSAPNQMASKPASSWAHMFGSDAKAAASQPKAAAMTTDPFASDDSVPASAPKSASSWAHMFDSDAKGAANQPKAAAITTDPFASDDSVPASTPKSAPSWAHMFDSDAKGAASQPKAAALTTDPFASDDSVPASAPKSDSSWAHMFDSDAKGAATKAAAMTMDPFASDDNIPASASKPESSSKPDAAFDHLFDSEAKGATSSSKPASDWTHPFDSDEKAASSTKSTSGSDAKVTAGSSQAVSDTFALDEQVTASAKKPETEWKNLFGSDGKTATSSEPASETAGLLSAEAKEATSSTQLTFDSDVKVTTGSSKAVPDPFALDEKVATSLKKPGSDSMNLLDSSNKETAEESALASATTAPVADAKRAENSPKPLSEFEHLFDSDDPAASNSPKPTIKSENSFTSDSKAESSTDFVATGKTPPTKPSELALASMSVGSKDVPVLTASTKVPVAAADTKVAASASDASVRVAATPSDSSAQGPATPAASAQVAATPADASAQVAKKEQDNVKALEQTRAKQAEVAASHPWNLEAAAEAADDADKVKQAKEIAEKANKEAKEAQKMSQVSSAPATAVLQSNVAIPVGAATISTPTLNTLPAASLPTAATVAMAAVAPSPQVPAENAAASAAASATASATASASGTPMAQQPAPAESVGEVAAPSMSAQTAMPVPVVQQRATATPAVLATSVAASASPVASAPSVVSATPIFTPPVASAAPLPSAPQSTPATAVVEPMHATAAAAVPVTSAASVLSAPQAAPALAVTPDGQNPALQGATRLEQENQLLKAEVTETRELLHQATAQLKDVKEVMAEVAQEMARKAVSPSPANVVVQTPVTPSQPASAIASAVSPSPANVVVQTPVTPSQPASAIASAAIAASSSAEASTKTEAVKSSSTGAHPMFAAPAPATANESAPTHEAPLSLAAFWSQEVRAQTTEPVSLVSRLLTRLGSMLPSAAKSADGKLLSMASFWTEEEHPGKTKELSLLAKQPQPEIDFVKLQTGFDEMHEVTISDRFVELENEDRQQAKYLEASDRQLRQEAKTKGEVKKQKPEVVAMLHGGKHHISKVWEHLEEQDKDIETALDSLDDPYKHSELSAYQRLNDVQDKSMSQLSRSLRNAQQAKHHRHDHQGRSLMSLMQEK